MSKRIFFKTVRENGDSLFAIGRFKQNYKVGKRYKFSKQFPAHVFVREDDLVDSEAIYANRAEGSNGNRVLICYGEVEEREVPRFMVDVDWDLNQLNNKGSFWRPFATRWCSTDFVIIGEIKPKVRDEEKKQKRDEYKVIELAKKTKKK